MRQIHKQIIYDMALLENIEIRELPIGELVENTGQIPNVPKNPRKITKEKFNNLVESIRTSPEMRMLDEVKVFPYDGKYVVISGNHRLKAYRHLGWKDVRCKVLPEDTPEEKLREYVIKENMHYAEIDEKLLKAWNVKELVGWDVPIALKSRGGGDEVGDVEFTEILDESHNYVVLYFDNDVDWLQAQTVLGIKSVRLLSTKKGADNVNGKKIGVGRVLRGSEVLNRLLGDNGMRSMEERKNDEV